MARYLPLGALGDAGLLAHRFAPYPVLAGLAYAALEDVGRLSANHASLSFCWFSHSGLSVRIQSLDSFSVDDSYLLGIFQDNFQAILRVVFDLSGDFDLFIFEIPWRRLGFVK